MKGTRRSWTMDHSSGYHAGLARTAGQSGSTTSMETVKESRNVTSLETYAYRIPPLAPDQIFEYEGNVIQFTSILDTPQTKGNSSARRMKAETSTARLKLILCGKTFAAYYCRTRLWGSSVWELQARTALMRPTPSKAHLRSRLKPNLPLSLGPHLRRHRRRCLQHPVREMHVDSKYLLQGHEGIPQAST